MLIRKTSIAGSMESSDIMIQVSPGEKGIHIDLESTVLQKYGDDVRASITDVARRLDVDNAAIKAVDKGALDCTIRARAETALLRAMEGAASDA